MTPTPQDSKVAALIAVVCLGLCAFSKAQPTMVSGEAPAPGSINEIVGGAVEPAPGQPNTPATRVDAHAGYVVPPHEWSLEARATLARACGREVGLEQVYRRDHAMIAFVSARRWREQRRGWSFAEATRRHANLHRPTPRTEWALTLPDALSGKAHAAWSSLVRFLDRWQAGKVADPCPRAVTWSGRQPTRKAVETIQRERLVRIWCGTKNQAWGRRGG